MRKNLENQLTRLNEGTMNAQIKDKETKEKEFSNYKDAFNEIGLDTKAWPYKITKEENKPRTKRTLEVFVRRCIAELVHECANYLLDNDEGTNVIQITKLKFTGEDEDI